MAEAAGENQVIASATAITTMQPIALYHNHEIRLKEGRVLSSSNRAKVQACKESLSALIADLDDLLTLSEPKPKEKEVNVESLRTQSLRMKSQAAATLA